MWPFRGKPIESSGPSEKGCSHSMIDDGDWTVLGCDDIRTVRCGGCGESVLAVDNAIRSIQMRLKRLEDGKRE